MSVSHNYTYSDSFEDISPTASPGKTATPVTSARQEDGATSLMHYAETEEIITVFHDPTELVPTVYSHTDVLHSIVTEVSMDTSAKTLPGSDKTLPGSDKTLSNNRQAQPAQEGSDDTASLYSYSESFDVTRLRSSEATDRDILSSSDLSFPESSPRIQASWHRERNSRLQGKSLGRSLGQSFRQSALSQGHSYYDDTFEDYTEDITASVIRFLPDQELVKLFPDEMITTDEEKEEEMAADRAQRDFVTSLIHRLQEPESSTPSLTDVSHVSVDEGETNPRVRKFCRKMMQNVKSGRQHAAKSEKKRATKQGRQPLEETVAAYGLNPAVLERLKLQNLQARLAAAANAEVHDIHTCKKCRWRLEKVETREGEQRFCKVHSQRLLASNMDRRVEQHLINNTGVTLIGKLAASLPLPSQRPEDLMLAWQNRAVAAKQQGLVARQQGPTSSTPS